MNSKRQNFYLLAVMCYVIALFLLLLVVRPLAHLLDLNYMTEFVLCLSVLVTQIGLTNYLRKTYCE